MAPESKPAGRTNLAEAGLLALDTAVRQAFDLPFTLNAIVTPILRFGRPQTAQLDTDRQAALSNS